jgi:hypothetical protein
MELGIQQGGILLYCDSQSAIYLAKNQVYHARTKHIDVRFHKISELVTTGELLLNNIHTSKNVADMLTNVFQVQTLLGLDKCLQVLERRGDNIPNLSVLGASPILDYLQRGKYSLRWRLLEQVAHILLLAH